MSLSVVSSPHSALHLAEQTYAGMTVLYIGIGTVALPDDVVCYPFPVVYYPIPVKFIPPCAGFFLSAPGEMHAAGHDVAGGWQGEKIVRESQLDGAEIVQSSPMIFRQRHLQCAEVIFQLRQGSGADDRRGDHRVTQCPGQRDL